MCQRGKKLGNIDLLIFTGCNSTTLHCAFFKLNLYLKSYTPILVTPVKMCQRGNTFIGFPIKNLTKI